MRLGKRERLALREAKLAALAVEARIVRAGSQIPIYTSMSRFKIVAGKHTGANKHAKATVTACKDVEADTSQFAIPRRKRRKPGTFKRFSIRN